MKQCKKTYIFENFINRFKLNFKQIVKSTLKISGALFTIISIVFVFFSWNDFNIDSRKDRLLILSSFVIISIILSLIYIFLIKRSRLIWKKGHAAIRVEYGDLLKKTFIQRLFCKNEKIYVIPVNTCFDTIVDSDLVNVKLPLVSPNSIHGKWIEKMRKLNYSADDLDLKISENLCKQNISFNILKNKSRGNTREYPFGTIAILNCDNETYFLLAISRFDENNVAYSNEEELKHCIESLIDFYRVHSQGYDLYIPLMGTDLSGAGLSHLESLDLISSILKVNNKKLRGEIHVVIYKGDKDRVSIFDI